jgi:hypothetical protein
LRTLRDPSHTQLSDFIDLWKAKEVETLGKLAPRTAAEQEEPADAEPEPSLDEKEIGK